MVQVINLGPSKSALQADVLQGTLGKALEEGLGKFTTNMFINKKMTEMENDKDLMAKPLSDRLLAAQKALAPWGEEGKQYYQQRMQIEQQKQIESVVDSMRNDIKKGNMGDYRDKYLQILPSLAMTNPNLAGELAQVMFKPQLAGIIPPKPSPGRTTAEKPTGPEGTIDQTPFPQMNENVPVDTGISKPQNATSKTNKELAAEAEQNFRNPQFQRSDQSTFPGSPLREEYQEPMTAEEMQAGAEDLVNRTQGLANPLSYQDGLKMMQQQNAAIEAHNANVTKQKQDRLTAQEQQYDRFLKRANDAGYDTEENPEMKSVVQKLALMAKDFPDENQAWDFIRPKIKEVSDAVNSIRTSSSPLMNSFSKMFSQGRVKSMQEFGEGVKNDINTLKKYGMYEELRNLLTGSVGLGPEQSENLIFPFEGGAREQLDAFPKSPFKGYKETGAASPFGGSDVSYKFPGESYSLPPKEFRQFEMRLGEYLNSNPGVNLVALRGQLNQGKRYSWQNISSAISNLIDNKVFKPDPVQVEQMKIVKEPPLPGLGEIFQYEWKGRQ